MKKFAITNFWVAQHRRKPILLSARTCQGVAPTQFREILIFDIRRKISRDFSQIVIFEITVPKTSFWIFSSSARESPWNYTKFMSRKISPKIISSWISSSFKIWFFQQKKTHRGVTKWGYALRVSKFAENLVLPENDTSVAPYTSRKPDFARGRHKCKRTVLTGFCSRSTPIRLRSRVGDQRRSRLEKPSSRWLKLVLGPHEFVFFHHLEL